MRSDLLERVPPQSLEAEQATLGAMLVEREAIVRVADELSTADFYSPQHGYLFDAMLELFRAGNPVDLVTVQAQLIAAEHLEAIGGVSYLIELQEAAPTAAAVGTYAEIVGEKSARRRAIRLAGELDVAARDQSAPLEAALSETQRQLYGLSARHHESYRSIGEVATATFLEIEAQKDSDKRVLGIPTGLRDLDSWLSGWQPAKIYVLGAYPAIGKTAFLLQAACVAADSGYGVCLFSLEMFAPALVRRYFASRAKINASHVTRALLSPEDWERLAHAADHAGRMPLWMYDVGQMSVDDLRARERRVAVDHKIDLVVIDYLQLLTKREENEELTQVMNTLRAMANETGVAILAASQLSRPQRTQRRRFPLPRPVLQDLRASGSLEQVADVVAFLHDPRNDEDELDRTREFIIRKQRDGPQGVVQLYWDPAYQSFANMAKQEQLEEVR